MDTALQNYLETTANQYGVPIPLAYNLVGAESGGNQSAVSPKGATGLTQLMPSTAADLGVDPTDPQQNIEGGLRYAAQLYNKYGNWDDAVRGYNAGPGRVDAWKAGQASLPAETVAYHAKVTGGQAAPTPATDDINPAFADLVPKAPQAPADDINPAFADVAPPSSPAAPDTSNSIPMGKGFVRRAGTSFPVPLAVENAVRADVKAGKFDQNPLTPGGTETKPFLVETADDARNIPPGAWFYNPQTGERQQAPGGVTESDSYGVERGIEKPFVNLSRGVDYVAHLNPTIGQGFDAGMRAVNGGHTIADDYRAWQGDLANKRAQGIVPSPVGQFTGSMIGTAPLALIGPEAMGGSALASAAAQGAAGGALTSDANSVGGVVRDTALGAAGGSVLHGVGTGIGAVVSPRVTPAVRTILDNGGVVTPGIAMGGFAKRVEDGAAKMLPWVSAGQQRAADSFASRVAPNDALSHLGQTLPADIEPGYATNDYVNSAVGDAYRNILPHISMRVDPEFRIDRAAVLASRDRLAPAQQGEFDRHIGNLFTGKFDRNGVMSGQNFQSTYSDLGNISQGYIKSPLRADQELGYTLRDAQTALDDAVARQNPNYVEPILNARRAAQANMIMRDAATRASANEGTFTPDAYASAVRNFDNSYKKGRFYTGDAVNQDLADAAKLMPNRIPNNGASIAPFMNLGLLDGGVRAIGAVNPAIGAVVNTLPLEAYSAGGAGALLGSMGAYSPTGMNVLRGMLSERPAAVQAVGNAIRRIPFGLIGGSSPVLLRNEPPGVPEIQ